MRGFMPNKFDNFTKEQLIDYINDLRKQLNNEKYGLYFDRKIALKLWDISEKNTGIKWLM